MWYDVAFFLQKKKLFHRSVHKKTNKQTNTEKKNKEPKTQTYRNKENQGSQAREVCKLYSKTTFYNMNWGS